MILLFVDMMYCLYVVILVRIMFLMVWNLFSFVSAKSSFGVFFVTFLMSLFVFKWLYLSVFVSDVLMVDFLDFMILIKNSDVFVSLFVMVWLCRSCADSDVEVEVEDVRWLFWVCCVVMMWCLSVCVGVEYCVDGEVMVWWVVSVVDDMMLCVWKWGWRWG